MIVRFDSLNRLEIPKLFVCSPGCVYSSGQLSSLFGILSDYSDTEIVFNFNSLSELNFRAYSVKHDTAEETRHSKRLYDSLQNRRMIFIDDIGFFVITNTSRGFDGEKEYKDITAQSAEIEIRNKKIPYIEDNTYQFRTLLENIVRTIPLWTIGYIDENISDRYRTFEDVSTDLNCHGFMLDNMQEAYDCIFVFDTINRTINVYDQNNYVLGTNIHITKNDLINSFDVSESSDDLYTSISVFGDNDITISPVNPLGTSTIYNFDYYTSWMSQELAAKVAQWKTLVSSYEETYYEKNVTYYQYLQSESTIRQDMSKLEIQLTMYNRCKDNIIAESGTLQVDSYNAVIIENGGQPIVLMPEIAQTIAEINELIAAAEGSYTAKQAELQTVRANIETIHGEIAEIQSQCAIENYFVTTVSGVRDTHLLDELSNYIYEGSYKDEYVTITDVMTYPERLEQMKTLYDRAVVRLEHVSEPTRQYSIDIGNFLFIKSFQTWSNELETGCLINAELEDGDIAQLFLASMSVNYDDHNLKFDFGNRFNKFDPKSLFENALGKIQKSANTLSYVKEILYPIKNGVIDEIKEEIRKSRTLSKNLALSSADQDIVIDDTGYTGRQKTDAGGFDPHQIKITNKSIVFTTDAWETCKTAIGEIIRGTGETTYGINAETIIGDMIIGSGLQIYTVSESGDRVALIDVVDGKITSEVTALNQSITELQQAADSVSIRVTTLEDRDIEVDHVTTTTGYTFNADGMSIHKSGNEIWNRIDHSGMYVSRGNDNTPILVANNDGVDAINVSVDKYLIIGDEARLEPYVGDNNEARTACFYIGG